MAKGTRDSGLGRGLSALLGEAALEPEQQGVTRLPIEKVQPNAAQPRKLFTTASYSPSPSACWPLATIRSSPANAVGVPPVRQGFPKYRCSLWRRTTRRPWNWD